MSDFSVTPGRVTRTGDVTITGKRLQRLENQAYSVRGNMETVHDADSVVHYADTLGADEGWGVGLDTTGILCVGLGRTANTPGLAFLGLVGAVFPEWQPVYAPAMEEDEEAGRSYLVYAEMVFGEDEESEDEVHVVCRAVPVEDAANIQQNGMVCMPLAWVSRLAEAEWTDIRQLHYGALNVPLRMG